MENGLRQLFINIYGKQPNCFQQDCFVEYLRERLNTKEKLYVLDKYGIDLLVDQEIENRIKKLMLHPIIRRTIFSENNYDEIDIIYSKIKGKQSISITSIQREFSVSFPRAQNILQEMKARGYVYEKDNKYFIK